MVLHQNVHQHEELLALLERRRLGGNWERKPMFIPPPEAFMYLQSLSITDVHPFQILLPASAKNKQKHPFLFWKYRLQTVNVRTCRETCFNQWNSSSLWRPRGKIWNFRMASSRDSVVKRLVFPLLNSFFWMLLKQRRGALRSSQAKYSFLLR